MIIMYQDRIKELREINRVLQKDLAIILDIDIGLYSQYEIEYKIMPLKHLIKIANYFNVSIDYLFNFTKKKSYKGIVENVSPKTAGLKLKEFRKKNKITQKELAMELHTTQSVMAGYETGRYLIATPFLYMICKKYNVSADYLLGRIENK